MKSLAWWKRLNLNSPSRCYLLQFCFCLKKCWAKTAVVLTFSKTGILKNFATQIKTHISTENSVKINKHLQKFHEIYQNFINSKQFIISIISIKDSHCPFIFGFKSLLDSKGRNIPLDSGPYYYDLQSSIYESNLNILISY